MGVGKGERLGEISQDEFVFSCVCVCLCVSVCVCVSLSLYVRVLPVFCLSVRRLSISFVWRPPTLCSDSSDAIAELQRSYSLHAHFFRLPRGGSSACNEGMGHQPSESIGEVEAEVEKEEGFMTQGSRREGCRGTWHMGRAERRALWWHGLIVGYLLEEGRVLRARVRVERHRLGLQEVRVLCVCVVCCVCVCV